MLKKLPTGTISMSQVNTELGYGSTRTISLGDSAVRKLAQDTSGDISMSSLRGKSNWSATHTIKPMSTSYYGEFVYGYASGSGTYNNHGTLTPNRIDVATIQEMIYDEGSNRSRIKLSTSITDPEIHVELSSGGTKFVFEKPSQTSVYYNLSSGNASAWRSFLYNNLNKSVSFKMWTW